MKYLFLIYTFLLSFSALSANYIHVYENRIVQKYEAESPISFGGPWGQGHAIEIPPQYDLNFISETHLVDEMVDNIDSPVWGTRSMVSPCSGEQDCKTKAFSLQCIDGRESFYNLEFTEVWCNKIISYNKKPSGKKKLEINQDDWTAYQNLIQSKAFTASLIENGKNAREACQKVLDLIGGFNLLPGRSSEQAGQMVATFAEAKQALQDGRPTAAKAAIQAIPVDGVLVTQDMKDLALNLLSDW